MSKRNLKYLDRYTGEIDFIPNVLTSLYMQGKIDDDFLMNPMQWKKILHKYGYGYDYGFRNIVVEKGEEDAKSKRKKFLMTFPKPNVVPECFYAILYIDRSGYDYYTLELDFGSGIIFKEGGGIICGQRGSSHLNYGRRCKDDLREFEKKVQEMIDGKPYDIKEIPEKIDYNALGKEIGMSAEEAKEKCYIF